MFLGRLKYSDTNISSEVLCTLEVKSIILRLSFINYVYLNNSIMLRNYLTTKSILNLYNYVNNTKGIFNANRDIFVSYDHETVRFYVQL